MPPPIRRIAINTGGGDAPGLNAVIKAVVHAAAHRWEVVGIREGYDGLLHPDRYPDGGLVSLTPDAVEHIAALGDEARTARRRRRAHRALARHRPRRLIMWTRREESR